MGYYTSHLPDRPEIGDLKSAVGQLFQLLAGVPESTEEQIRKRLDDFLKELETEASAQRRFRALYDAAARHFSFSESLADVGLSVAGTFNAEFFRRIRHQILPPYYPRHSGEAFFYRVLRNPGRQSLRVFEALTPQQWARLEAFIPPTSPDFGAALVALAVRIRNMASRIVYSDAREDVFREPLEELLYRTIRYRKDAEKKENYESLKTVLSHCQNVLNGLEKDLAKDNHTSLELSFNIGCIRKALNRMNSLMAWNESPEQRLQTIVTLVRDIYDVRSPRVLLYENLGSLAYVISELKSDVGEHYITVTRKEFWKFFLSACGGGVFAALMAFVKILIHAIHPALFWQHLLYSINYAAGFCGIQLSGSTLATKQPSMTAARLAADFDTNKNQLVTPKEIAFIFTRLWRSQFAAFAGNLLVVFPVAISIAWLQDVLSGAPPAHGPEAVRLVREQNPLYAPVWYYASVTGIALFLSSVFAGYVENYLYVHRIPDRLCLHPWLSQRVHPKRLHNLSRFLVLNGGGLAGNILLGFLLGFPGFFATIFGIDFDIRHITISTAHYAMGLYALTTDEFFQEGLWPLLGISIIGILNFLVSFSLAFYVALRARKISASALPAVMRQVIRYVRRRPQDFWYPPKDPYSIRI